MTPKDKARELFDKYATYAVMWTGGIDVEKQNCKMCALIAVDEILLLCPFETYSETLSPYDGAELSTKYWQEVRQEIENL